jgi:hypothetical protein
MVVTSIQRNIFVYFLFVLILISFSVRSYTLLDPDFGWHVRMGEIVSTISVPTTDPFSYTMPSFAWVDHALLTDVFLAKIYPIIGMAGLSILFSGLALTSLLLVIPKIEWKIAAPLILLSGATLIDVVGIRPQIIDWLMVALVWRTLEKEAWEKYRFIAPFLFIIWANLHGGFIIGIAIVTAARMTSALLNKRFDYTDLVIVALCTLGTLVNYYGVGLWGEIWLTIMDYDIRNKISEWMPFWKGPSISYALLATLEIMLISKYWRLLEKWKVSVFLLVVVVSLSSFRNLPFGVLIGASIALECMNLFYIDLKLLKRKSVIQRFWKFNMLFCLSTFIIFAMSVLLSIKNADKISVRTYPTNAINFLKSKSVTGEVFSEYKWGGYLIWKLPSQRVFIDGRMPSWESHASPIQESGDAFEEYSKIVNGHNAESYFDKYNIQTILVTNPNNAYLISAITPQFIAEVENGEWKKIYEDDIALIYER